MSKPRLLLTAFLLAAPASLLAAVTPKPGLWSLEILMGQPLGDIDTEALEQFGIVGLEIPKAQPRRYEICLTPEQIARNTFPDLQDPSTGCTATQLKRSGDRVTGQIACSGGWMQGNGDVAIDLVSADRYTGRTRFRGASQEGLPLNMDGTLGGQWLGPDCGDVAPAMP